MILQSLYIELTQLCNLHCQHCYNSSQGSSSIDFISLERFIRSASNYGLKRITLSGGEPLMYPYFSECIHLINSIPDLELRLVTNGTLLYKVINQDDISIQDFSLIQVSLDASCKDTYESIRGKGIWDTLIKDITSISKIFPLRLKMTLSKININEIQSFFDYCVELNCIPIFGTILPLGRAKSQFSLFALTNNEIISAGLLINSLYAKHHINEKYIPYRYHCSLNGSAPMSWLIKANGDIHPCELLYDPLFRIGTINDSINEIYNCSKLQSLITQTQNNAGRPECESCIAKSTCDGGCLALSYFNHDSGISGDNGCIFRRRILAQQLFRKG